METTIQSYGPTSTPFFPSGPNWFNPWSQRWESLYGSPHDCKGRIQWSTGYPCSTGSISWDRRISERASPLKNNFNEAGHQQKKKQWALWEQWFYFLAAWEQWLVFGIMGAVIRFWSMGAAIGFWKHGNSDGFLAAWEQWLVFGSMGIINN